MISDTRKKFIFFGDLLKNMKCITINSTVNLQPKQTTDVFVSNKQAKSFKFLGLISVELHISDVWKL